MATEDGGGAIEKVSEVAGGSGEGNVLSTLMSKELLIPAAVSAAGALAASKGPDLLKKLSGEGDEKAQELGQQAVEGAKGSLGSGGGIGGKLLGKALGGGKGGGGGDGKKTRRLPIQRWTDVAVPVDQAYEAWLKFDEYPKFMHRVLTVEQKDDDRVAWQEKIWFSRRQWEGEITDRRENELIAWKSKNGPHHKGVVTFHPLGDRLTRVMVDMEFEPTGMIEKMASGLRFVKRAVQADLARFKAYVELGDVEGIDYREQQDDRKQDDRKQDDRKQDDGEQDDERGEAADEPQSRERQEQEREEREQRRQERRQRT